MTNIMTELGLIFFASVIFMLLALKLRFPPVVGLLFAGAVIGPNVLRLVPYSEYIDLFSQIGAILLLFFVGIEFSINKVTKMGLRPIVVWLAKDAFVFIIVYEISLLLGLNEITSLVLASALAISSTTFFIKLVGEKNISGSAEANLVFIVLIIEDVLAVFLLAIYSGIGHSTADDISIILLSILRAILILTLAYFVLGKIIHVAFEKLSKYKSDEITLFLSLSFAILFSFFVSSIGLAPSIGAFLAGSVLSSVRGFKSTQDTLSKFGMLFSAFFFISIGMLVDPNGIFANITIIAILFLFLCCGTFGSVFLISYLVGYRSHVAVRSGLLILTVGEFSLLIATQTKDIVASFDIISVTTALVFLTALSGGILIKKENEIDTLLGKMFPNEIKKSGKGISRYFNEVFKAFERGGIIYNTFIDEGRKITINIIIVVSIAISVAFCHSVLQNSFQEYAKYVIILGVVLGIVPIIGILFSLKKMIGNTAQAFHAAMGENLALDDIAMRDSLIMFFMFLIAMITPLTVSAMRLPNVFGLLFIIPLFIAILFLWNVAVTVKLDFKKLT
ncbi:MAG: cation:proton antiporter [Candidatus Micrarchaeota archaeon]